MGLDSETGSWAVSGDLCPAAPQGRLGLRPLSPDCPVGRDSP
jgi:hypothetical protein